MPLLTTREIVPFALSIALPHIAKMFLVPMLRNVNKCCRDLSIKALLVPPLADAVLI
jgi:hypothetical protein